MVFFEAELFERGGVTQVYIHTMVHPVYYAPVCAAVCCSTQQHRGGGSERQKKHIIYREIYKFKVHNHNKHAG